MSGILGVIGLLVIMCGIIPSRAQDYPPQEVKHHLRELHDSCVKKLGVPDDITKGYDFQHKSKEIMCYMKCILIEGEWAGEDEVVNFDDMLKRAHKDLIPYLQKVIDKCQNLPRSTQDCETTHTFWACARDADPERFFMP